MDTSAIRNAIKRTEDKLKRQEEALAATRAELDILNDALAKPVKPK